VPVDPVMEMDGAMRGLGGEIRGDIVDAKRHDLIPPEAIR
jgi:hypothetical protein